MLLKRLITCMEHPDAPPSAVGRLMSVLSDEGGLQTARIRAFTLGNWSMRGLDIAKVWGLGEDVYYQEVVENEEEFHLANPTMRWGRRFTAISFLAKELFGSTQGSVSF